MLSGLRALRPSMRNTAPEGGQCCVLEPQSEGASVMRKPGSVTDECRDLRWVKELLPAFHSPGWPATAYT